MNNQWNSIFSLPFFKSACDADPCENYATCQSGYTHKKYRCQCLSGFTGENCESGKNFVKFEIAQYVNEIVNRKRRKGTKNEAACDCMSP